MMLSAGQACESAGRSVQRRPVLIEMGGAYGCDGLPEPLRQQVARSGENLTWAARWRAEMIGCRMRCRVRCCRLSL